MINELIERTKKFALDCWRLCSKIPKSREFNAYVYQLLKSSSSVGSNYWAFQRAKSTADFINKLKIVEEKIYESIYWLELFSEILPEFKSEIEVLMKDGNELLAIFVASIKTARKNNNLK